MSAASLTHDLRTKDWDILLQLMLDTRHDVEALNALGASLACRNNTIKQFAPDKTGTLASNEDFATKLESVGLKIAAEQALMQEFLSALTDYITGRFLQQGPSLRVFNAHEKVWGRSRIFFWKSIVVSFSRDGTGADCIESFEVKRGMF